MKFKPTEEQQAIVDLALKGEDVAINAYAGAAKTTTCAMIANTVVKPSLYLAFNKAMAEEAKQKMPSHVECRTWHSIAYQECFDRYMGKSSTPSYYIRPTYIGKVEE